MHPRDSSKNITDTQRQAALPVRQADLPVRQAAAAEMHKDVESVRPASSSADIQQEWKQTGTNTLPQVNT